MQQNRSPYIDSSIKELWITIILGLLIGIISGLFITLLRLVAIKQLELNSGRSPIHTFMMPFVLLLLHLFRTKSLFYPLKIKELSDPQIKMVSYWSPWMSVFHFIGTLFSHMAGASVGREGTVVLISAGFVRVFNLAWSFWGPIAIGCGFSAITGVGWIGLFFSSELFNTNLKQKIFTLIASCISVLLLQTFQIRHLFENIILLDDFSFFTKLQFIFYLALLVGLIMRFYKFSYNYLHHFLKQKSIMIRFLIACALAFILMQPEFRKFQSLGLLQFENLELMQFSFRDGLFKLAFTLFSTVCGFWGGEFIPLVYGGLHLGGALAQQLNIHILVGSSLGAYLLFAGGMQLKWTSYFLIISIVGLSWWFWAYVLVSLTIRFSGENSLYRQ